MVEVVGVRFKRVGKVYYFDAGELYLKKEDNVIVETTRGVEYGTVVMEKRAVSDEEVVQPLRKILRLATQNDRDRIAENKKNEREAFAMCQEKIRKHNLEMKLVDVEYTFDHNKILFYFTADGRVDFRDLVRDLAGIFKTRIELRQIGVRDEAKMLGGLGICGRALCCNTYLGDFQPVSIKMAKEQSMSLNPTKISGTCGRLMCCLKNEQEAYESLLRSTPGVGSTVKTADGRGVVARTDLLKGRVAVTLDADGEKQIKEYAVADVEIVKKAGKKDGGKAKDGDKRKGTEETS